MRKLLLNVVMTVCGTAAMSATNYLVDPQATTTGATITHKGVDYVVGTTAFASFSEFNAASPEAGAVLTVAPGTYNETVTLTTSNLKIYGSNAFRDWTVARDSETIITGVLNLNASGIEVNGCYFTGAGRVSAKAATNAAPQSGIRIVYNYFAGSTVARSKSTPLVAIGTRYTNANANAAVSQCQYKDCEVSHNRFEGTSTHIANAVGLAGVYGTTTVTDNYFYDGGTSIHIDNAQGALEINHNTFKNVGVTTASAPDGGTAGDFCIYAMRCAYANTTNLNIRHNTFDGCYGQSSYFSLIRVYPGSSGATSCVTPVNMSVNINHNTFKNKTSGASNSGQLNENMLLYADKGTTPNVKFNIADNHYDNRFYKFAWVTLADGLGQREVYSNSFDQFVFGSSYSTMGTSIIDGVDISNHAKGVSLGAVTVLQSMDIDMKTGDMYFLQLMNSGDISSFCSTYGLNATNCEPLVLTRVSCTKKATKSDGTFTYSTTVQKMRIAKAGHGVKLSVVRDKNGQLWMITGGKGSDNGTSNDLSGKSIARFKFVSGKTLILDGSGTYDSDVVYFKHPAGLSNAYGAVDEASRYLCVSSSGSGTRKYYIYDLDEYLEGSSSPTLIKSVSLKTGDDPITGTGLSNDNGFCTWSYQSYAINGDYLYLLEGESQETDNPVTSGDPVVVISTYNWRTGQYLLRTRVNYARINDTFGEPEAFTIRPDVFGNVSAYLGIATGSSGSRKAAIFKYHIDRHLDDAGAVIGVDTSTKMKHFNTAQYSGITMTTSESAYSLSAASLSETPSQTITITKSTKYLYGNWTGTITGEDGKVFDVAISDNTPFSGSFTATVTFNPDGVKGTYTAYLRLSSPLATDILIPINATYTAISDGGEDDDTEEEVVSTDNITSLSEVWNFSQISAKTADWVTYGTQVNNDIAVANGKLYAVYRNTATSVETIYIVDAYTGEKLGSLDVSPCTTGTHLLSAVETIGGKVIACNLAAGATSVLNVYLWDNDNATPTTLLSTTEHGGGRTGDAMSVSGDLTNGKIWFAYGSNAYYYTITNGVVTSTTPTTIALTKGGAEYDVTGTTAYSNITVESDGSFWVVSKENVATRFNSAGEYIEEISADILGDKQGTDLKFFTLGSKRYAVATTYLNVSNTAISEGALRLLNVTDGTASAAVIGTYPANGLGSTKNSSFRTSVCAEVAEKDVWVWVNVPYQGAACYKFEHKTVGVEELIGDTVEDEAPAVYYNLQGIKVDADNLTPGIYVKVQGKTATKLLVK